MFDLDKKIFQQYGEIRFESDNKTHILQKYLWRKLSLPFTFVFLKLGLSPNAITFLSLIFVIISFYAILLGDYSSLLIASFSLIIYSIFDHSDGEVARITGRSSVWGDFFDDFVGLVKDTLIIFSLTINLSSADSIYWYYGFLTLVFLMFSTWIKPEIGSHFSKSERRDKLENLVIQYSRYNLKKIYYTIFSGLTRTFLVIFLLPFNDFHHILLMILGFCFFDFIGNLNYAYIISRKN